MVELPSAVLFACTMNSVRSPMAEGILKFLHGNNIYIDSTGVRASEVDGFAVAVMDEIGIDMLPVTVSLQSDLVRGDVSA